MAKQGQKLPPTKAAEQVFPRGGPAERDIEQAITALKKGANLLKYGRRGKPKFCSFKLSGDEADLVYYSGASEKTLTLSTVSSIYPGQRTPVFKRYPRPDKEYQSFSLIYQNGERSLDLICKDKDEAEIWFMGLKALITNVRKPKFESRGLGGSRSKVASSQEFYNSPRSSLLDMANYGSQDELQKAIAGGSSQGGTSQRSSTPGSPSRENSELPSPQEGDGSGNLDPSGPHHVSRGSDDFAQLLAEMRQSGEILFDAGPASWSGRRSPGSSLMGAELLERRGRVSPGLAGGEKSNGAVLLLASGRSPPPFGSFMSLVSEDSFTHTTKSATFGEWKYSGRLDMRQSRELSTTSSQGSGAEGEDEVLGDVHAWGEGLAGGVLGGGVRKGSLAAMGSGVAESISATSDALLPRALESSVVLDVINIACGGRHAALVNRRGEVFCWGEESGGRLGHGTDCDVPHPQLVEALASTNTVQVACGEFHTCAVTQAGEVYSWGDGTHCSGLLGHGNDISHWIPRKISGPLDGLVVRQVSCGPWHSAVITEAGQLFTFGDGTFGALGHGDYKSYSTPKEVDAFKNMYVSTAACGVWHMAAIVERRSVLLPGDVAGALEPADGFFSPPGDLYTWGDGDKGRLGFKPESSSAVSVPMIVESLQGHSFSQVACGHCITVALTFLGQVYVMGSSAYGQLGVPGASGRDPVLVEGKLKGSPVEQIACGAFHVAALSITAELFTWGNGASGRLGHGDSKDRESPTLVTALKDKRVTHVACGVSYTVVISQHKFVTGADHSMCTQCKQQFGFTRHRHNCYQCGHIFCSSCSSKRALRAAMAPDPNKAYRVCDSCFLKISNLGEGGELVTSSMRSIPGTKWKAARGKLETNRSSAGGPTFLPSVSKSYPPPAPGAGAPGSNPGPGGQRARGTRWPGEKSDRIHPAPQWGIVNAPPSFPRPAQQQMTGAVVNATQPASLGQSAARPSDLPPLVGLSGGLDRVRDSQSKAVAQVVPREIIASNTPRPSTAPSGSKGSASSSASSAVVDDLKRTNDALSLETVTLRRQIEELQARCLAQERELAQSRAEAGRQVQQAVTVAGEEFAKAAAAKEVIKSLSLQLKEVMERLPEGALRGMKMLPSASLNGTVPYPVEDSIPSPKPPSEDANMSVRAGHDSVVWGADDRTTAGTEALEDSLLTASMAEATRTTQARKAQVAADMGPAAPPFWPGMQMLLATAVARPPSMIVSAVDASEVDVSSTSGSFLGLPSQGRSRPRPSLPPSLSRPAMDSSSNGFSAKEGDEGLPEDVGEPCVKRSGRAEREVKAGAEGEWVEQVEQGVFITLQSLPLQQGTELRRVRFSRKLFSERQAEAWWTENRLRVHELYCIRSAGSTSSQTSDLSQGSTFRPQSSLRPLAGELLSPSTSVPPPMASSGNIITTAIFSLPSPSAGQTSERRAAFAPDMDKAR